MSFSLNHGDSIQPALPSWLGCTRTSGFPEETRSGRGGGELQPSLYPTAAAVMLRPPRRYRHLPRAGRAGGCAGRWAMAPKPGCSAPHELTGPPAAPPGRRTHLRCRPRPRSRRISRPWRCPPHPPLTPSGGRSRPAVASLGRTPTPLRPAGGRRLPPPRARPKTGGDALSSAPGAVRTRAGPAG